MHNFSLLPPSVFDPAISTTAGQEYLDGVATMLAAYAVAAALLFIVYAIVFAAACCCHRRCCGKARRSKVRLRGRRFATGASLILCLV